MLNAFIVEPYSLLTVNYDQAGLPNRYIVQPNRSLTPAGMLLFFLLVALAAISLAIRFVLLGAWMVLPFALLEVLGLGAAFLVYERSSRYREIIDFGKDHLRVERSKRARVEKWEFQPYWVRLVEWKDAASWYPGRLFLRSHGRELEIGACLTEEERRELAAGLARYIRNA
ncbi:MAG: DUF2244 domain-containing protein [gamma proteobacterium symbiont of Bathyaustriella thionipta]|nr:DUF2244 domain-containing protein [gamma proteobacterium symbiont of Bathyaustriella thionipta]